MHKGATAKLKKVNEHVRHFVVSETQMPFCDFLNRIGLPSLVNQCLAKIAHTVFNVINNEHTPKSTKDLVEHRNNKYNLRGNDILKRPMANSSTYGLKSWRFTAPKLWNSIPDS